MKPIKLPATEISLFTAFAKKVKGGIEIGGRTYLHAPEIVEVAGAVFRLDETEAGEGDELILHYLNIGD